LQDIEQGDYRVKLLKDRRWIFKIKFKSDHPFKTLYRTERIVKHFFGFLNPKNEGLYDNKKWSRIIKIKSKPLVSDTPRGHHDFWSYLFI
jgi:hypothetical protein